MRGIAVAALLGCCSCPVLADRESCHDVVGVEAGAAEQVLEEAAKRSRQALNPVKARAGEGLPAALRSRAGIAADTHRQNLRVLREVETRHVLARMLTAPASCELLDAQDDFGLALGLARASAEDASHFSAQYGLYVGPNYSLGGAGDWRPGAETLARFDTEIFSEEDEGYGWLKAIAPKGGWLRGYSEFSYQSINALEEAEDAASGSVPASNVFSSAGGYLRLNAGLQVHYTNWFGLQFGSGLSSLPNSDNVTRMEPRAFLGLHFQTLFRDGALAQFFLGAAYDEFWESAVFNDPLDPLAGTRVENHFGRYNIDGLIFLPGQAGNFHLASRLFADAPMDGEGPSDVRVSLLIYYDFNKWLDTYLPIRKAGSIADSLEDD